MKRKRTLTLYWRHSRTGEVIADTVACDRVERRRKWMRFAGWVEIDQTAQTVNVSGSTAWEKNFPGMLASGPWRQYSDS